MKKLVLVVLAMVLVMVGVGWAGEMPTISTTASTFTSGNVLALADGANATWSYLVPSSSGKVVLAADSTGRRLVRVMIVDPETQVPLDGCVLYSEPEKLTDMTNQELFFAIPDFQTKVAEYNKKRVKMLDKEASKKFGRDIYLEPIKIRDLKMVVVTVASF